MYRIYDQNTNPSINLIITRNIALSDGGFALYRYVGVFNTRQCLFDYMKGKISVFLFESRGGVLLARGGEHYRNMTIIHKMKYSHRSQLVFFQLETARVLRPRYTVWP